jgi:hypothetical protein
MMVMFERFNSFFTWLRNFVFLDFDSIKYKVFCGLVIAMGMAGNPEPEPKSNSVSGVSVIMDASVMLSWI